jgi:hypothetical protein
MADKLGHSLLLRDGDLVFDDHNLVEIEGRENLMQALVLRVLTPLGTDPFTTTYGLDVKSTFTQPVATHIVKELVKLNLVRTLSTDPRVSEIRDIVFPDDPEVIAANPALDAAAARLRRQARLWRVEVTITTVDDSSQTLDLTIGV